MKKKDYCLSCRKIYEGGKDPYCAHCLLSSKPDDFELKRKEFVKKVNET